MARSRTSRTQAAPTKRPRSRGRVASWSSCSHRIGSRQSISRSETWYGTEMSGDDEHADEVTARRAAETALRESRSTLADVEHLAKIGTWSWGLVSQELTWSDE